MFIAIHPSATKIDEVMGAIQTRVDYNVTHKGV